MFPEQYLLITACFSVFLLPIFLQPQVIFSWPLVYQSAVSTYLIQPLLSVSSVLLCGCLYSVTFNDCQLQFCSFSHETSVPSFQRESSFLPPSPVVLYLTLGRWSVLTSGSSLRTMDSFCLELRCDLGWQKFFFVHILK